MKRIHLSCSLVVALLVGLVKLEPQACNVTADCQQYYCCYQGLCRPYPPVKEFNIFEIAQ